MSFAIIRNKSQSNIVSGILPRVGASPSWYKRAFTVKAGLKKLCVEEGVVFVNVREEFTKKLYLFR